MLPNGRPGDNSLNMATAPARTDAKTLAASSPARVLPARGEWPMTPLGLSKANICKACGQNWEWDQCRCLDTDEEDEEDKEDARETSNKDQEVSPPPLLVAVVTLAPRRNNFPRRLRAAL